MNYAILQVRLGHYLKFVAFSFTNLEGNNLISVVLASEVTVRR